MIIKNSCGFNPHAVRDSLINATKSGTYPRCMIDETWDHIVKCASTKTMRTDYLKNIRETLMRTKTHEKKINETNDIFSDVKNYLGGQRDCVTTQGIIGIDKIFRGYIVKNWHGDDEDCESHHEINKIIVKKSVEFYVKFWNHRNSCLNEI